MSDLQARIEEYKEITEIEALLKLTDKFRDEIFTARNTALSNLAQKGVEFNLGKFLGGKVTLRIEFDGTRTG